MIPEKWCIRGSNELDQWGNTFINGKYNYAKSLRNKSCLFSNIQLHGDSWYHYSLHCSTNLDLQYYTEITFEQFKKYILKQQTTYDVC